METELRIINGYFDGGGTKAFAYGSWEVLHYGLKKRVSRESYDNYPRFEVTGKETSSVAEYLALIHLLEWVDSVKQKEKYRLSIWGDSLLIVNQVTRMNKTKAPNLIPLKVKSVQLFNQWPNRSITWHPRINSVSRFGH